MERERERERESRGGKTNGCCWLLRTTEGERIRNRTLPHITHKLSSVLFRPSLSFSSSWIHIATFTGVWRDDIVRATGQSMTSLFFFFFFLFRRPTLEAHRYSSLYNATYRPSFYWPGCSTWSACAKHISILTNEQHLVCIARRRVFEC